MRELFRHIDRKIIRIIFYDHVLVIRMSSTLREPISTFKHQLTSQVHRKVFETSLDTSSTAPSLCQTCTQQWRWGA